LKDVYHGQFIIKDGIIPAELVYSCPYFLKQMVGVDVPYNVYTHIAGVDLIRSNDGQYYVLEDNLRTLLEFLICWKIEILAIEYFLML
jgi:uncharacterized circularly permuted ATP-grasp superfamily protein